MGGGSTFQRVAEELRRRIADGVYPTGSSLPSQRDLAAEYLVSRDTVQRVLRDLVAEGWIESRQGSGSRVVRTRLTDASPSTGLRRREVMGFGPCISEAFERDEVTLDVFALTPEPLAAHTMLQAERIHTGSIAPERIALRVLLPSYDLPLPYPRARDDHDDPRLAERLRAITKWHTDSLCRLFRDLQSLRLVPSAELQIRHAPLTPTFQLYLLNDAAALHAMYQVMECQVPLGDGDELSALDVMTIGAVMTHHVKDADPSSQGSVFVDSMRSWFDSVWTLLSEPSE